jgi:hypothetical protein
MMRKIAILATVALCSAFSTAQAQSVDGELSWCSGDWGHNEGASEAIQILSKYGSVIDPATTAMVNAGIPLVGAIVNIFNPNADPAGEVLKRPPIMQAATVIVHTNPDDAVDLAITCQAHNGASINFLNARRSEVANWLRTHTISF